VFVGKLLEPVGLSVAAGLVFGKPIGVLLFCWLSMKLGLTRMPAGVTWPMMVGAACLAGIGFTMALFLKILSFPSKEFAAMEAAGKIGTPTGSLISAIVGVSNLVFAVRKN
jgi:Na+:H+ antiporter, NhaA family